MMPQSIAMLTALAVAAMGCAAIGKGNGPSSYSTVPKMVCTSPQMVDGDLNTGDTLYIEGTMGSGERTVSTPDSQYADMFAPTTVTLPAKRRVVSIVLHARNLTNFKVLARDGSEWKELHRIRNNRLNRVVLTKSVETDALRFIAIDFGQIRGRPRPEIQEIEVSVEIQKEEAFRSLSGN
ncbi:MAG: hypothetical protein OXN17_11690 [Candidatus Poribacteria bacterium]|nr:hypothetical protein [Candidatus Poribacteria bacterium]MDE0506180.1 hypothetical protein [Candidatus Poribacteria bacterium]